MSTDWNTPIGEVIPVGKWTPWTPISVLEEFPEFDYGELPFTAKHAFICNVKPCVAAWMMTNKDKEDIDGVEGLCFNPHSTVAFKLTTDARDRPVIRADLVAGGRRCFALGWIPAKEMKPLCIHF